MKNKLNYLRQYIPWLLIIFGIEVFSAILLWIADVRAFYSMLVLMILFTVIAIGLSCYILIRLEIKRERAFAIFLSRLDEDSKRGLLSAYGDTHKKTVDMIISSVEKMQAQIKTESIKLSDYEDYVEIWAHEMKISLSLLTMILDNNQESLTGDVKFKLDYIRNQIGDKLTQILYYYRIRGEKRDFLFEDFNVAESIKEILEDYMPLLREKKFDIKIRDLDTNIYSDKRGFEFIIAQILSNAIKYAGDSPRLEIVTERLENYVILKFTDNGCGVKECDINHIFEKGFTGDSGDIRKKSTGMGLYLAKHLADDLKIKIDVKSKWMSYFEISLYISCNI